jgi:hypothetical protein
MCHISYIYFSQRINDLTKNAHAQGLDKIFQRLGTSESQPCLRAVNTNGAGRKAHAVVLLTLYIQNIRLEGVNPPHFTSLYYPPNQSLKQKCSRLGS